MKLLFGLILSVVLPASAGWAQQVSSNEAPATREDVQRLFGVMNNRDQMRRMIEQMLVQMKAMHRERTKKAQPDISEEEMSRNDREADQLIRIFPIVEILNDTIPFYQRHFAKSEIEALITVFSSPAGQKFLREMPTVTRGAHANNNSAHRSRCRSGIEALREERGLSTEVNRIDLVHDLVYG